MKKRITRLIVAAFVAIIMSGISACKNSETKKTDDFADLIAARDAALDTVDGLQAAFRGCSQHECGRDQGQ